MPPTRKAYSLGKRLTGVPRNVEQPAGPPPAPSIFVGTEPEWRVYWWLERHNIVFDFQSSLLGGRAQLGGLVVDFLIQDRDPGLVINVQGEYWHGRFVGGIGAQDLLTKIRLLNLGFDVVYVREADIMDRLDYTMSEALRGIQLFEDQ